MVTLTCLVINHPKGVSYNQGSQVPTLADVIAPTFGQRSLIVSASGSCQFTSAFLGVNRYSNPVNENAFSFCFDQKVIWLIS
jgi:hypothetical protein